VGKFDRDVESWFLQRESESWLADNPEKEINDWLIEVGLEAIDIWKSSVAILNDLDWDLSWREVDSHWCLYADSKLVFKCTTWGELEAFVCGLAQHLDSLMNLGAELSGTKMKLSIADILAVGGQNRMSKTMSIQQMTEVVNELYDVNKVLRVFSRRYQMYSSSAYYLYGTNSGPHPEYIERWVRTYEMQIESEKRLQDLAKDGISRLRSAAVNRVQAALSADEVFPVVLALLLKAGDRPTWLEEIGPSLQEGPWLEEEDCWLEKGQWPKSKGSWHFSLGKLLQFTGYSKGEMVAFVYGRAYAIASLPPASPGLGAFLKKVFDDL
jgi:hypothetical protein